MVFACVTVGSALQETRGDGLVNTRAVRRHPSRSRPTPEPMHPCDGDVDGVAMKGTTSLQHVSAGASAYPTRFLSCDGPALPATRQASRKTTLSTTRTRWGPPSQGATVT